LKPTRLSHSTLSHTQPAPSANPTLHLAGAEASSSAFCPATSLRLLVWFPDKGAHHAPADDAAHELEQLRHEDVRGRRLAVVAALRHTLRERQLARACLLLLRAVSSPPPARHRASCQPVVSLCTQRPATLPHASTWTRVDSAEEVEEGAGGRLGERTPCG
jgi:hypothetical protein